MEILLIAFLPGLSDCTYDYATHRCNSNLEVILSLCQTALDANKAIRTLI